MCWLSNSCIVYECKTKDCVQLSTFQHKSWHLCLLLWCLLGFITIPSINYDLTYKRCWSFLEQVSRQIISLESQISKVHACSHKTTNEPVYVWVQTMKTLTKNYDYWLKNPQMLTKSRIVISKTSKMRQTTCK